MQSVKSIHTPIPLRDRLSMRLALLFAAAFLGTLLLIGAWAIFDKIGERSQTAVEVSVQQPAIVIDPKIQAELSKALTFDATPAVTQVQNPFVDRANLAGSAPATTTASFAKPNSGPSSTTVAAARSVGSSGTTTNSYPTTGSGSLPLGAYAAPVDNTKERYEDWLARSKRGEFVVAESEVLGVGDLVPVGYASGGSRGAEVILMSLSLCRTFSFPAGTRLFDGFLNGFDQQEVVFVFQNGIRRKSYSTQDVCQQQDGSAKGAGITN